ncbi:MAG: amino acid racemase [Firmicutes bacterium]|jgi:aspartate racemase|nr:amino acid racemase [Bacillota bacterium]
MKTIGILGGLTWQSTLLYYRYLNEMVRDLRQGESSAEIVLRSIDFAPLDQAQRKGDEETEKEILLQAAQSLVQAGADFWLMACNTTHRWADYLQEQIDLPFLHIAESVATALDKEKIKRVALTGTPYTMEAEFYPRIFAKKGIDLILPEAVEIKRIEEIIDLELSQGIIKEQSLQEFREMSCNWQEKGAEAVVLACTELGLLIKDDPNHLRVFDSLLIHCQDAVSLALA